ncbi:MAG: TldD/PmbA family protein [Acidobacteriia bacterium]|nr:TldD/PmbA family protein [Terriglobia bacterium]
MSFKEIAGWALDTIHCSSAQYADVRIVDFRQRKLSTRNGRIGVARTDESLGVGIRVLVDGAWGFAATQDLSRESVNQTSLRAVEFAASSSRGRSSRIELRAEQSACMSWSSPCQIDPLKTSIEENLDLLVRVERELLSVKGVTLAETNLLLRRHEQWFYNTEGSDVHQVRFTTGAGFVAYSFKGAEIQRRSFPNCFGGNYQNKGYEFIEELKLVENARPIAEQAVALHDAVQCPEGKMSLILGSSQLGLQIHESIGHAVELDRVLGSEANFAGTSFLAVDKLRALRYGSEILNVVADATEEQGTGMGTFAYDDEGVRAQCTPIIRNGIFTGFISSRETAHHMGEAGSNGAMRAESWNRVPIIRMTNISIVPGETPLTLDQLVADTDRGIFMDTNRSWSIDDKRYNFQFGCEIGWEIKGGKLGRIFKNPSYSGNTIEFWNSIDAVCSDDEWTMWGLPNCGKGQPRQELGTGHGAVPVRFKQVRIGSAYRGNTGRSA